MYPSRRNEDKSEVETQSQTMSTTYLEMKAQLQTIVDELEQYKVINKSLQAEVEMKMWLKEWKDDENHCLQNQN